MRRDAAEALQPLTGSLASTLFALGLLGAALLAAAVVPLSTAYSVSEAFGREAALDDSLAEAPFFYVTFIGVLAIGAAVVLVPGVELVPVLVLTQVLSAVLLLPLLVVMQRLARDRDLMGSTETDDAPRWLRQRPSRFVAASVVGLGVAVLAGV